MSDPAPRPTGETQAHRDLKRLALIWAQMNGFRIAATEVSLPNHRVRMDAAAYRPTRILEPRRDERLKTSRLVWKPTVGVTAIFECKVSRIDFVRDARSMQATLERLKVLQERRGKTEHELKIHYPSIRNGDSLFQEYETLNFERPGYERYEKIVREMRQLSGRLHANTKFDRLTKYGAANLFYVVAELGPGDAGSVALWLGPSGTRRGNAGAQDEAALARSSGRRSPQFSPSDRHGRHPFAQSGKRDRLCLPAECRRRGWSTGPRDPL